VARWRPRATVATPALARRLTHVVYSDDDDSDDEYSDVTGSLIDMNTKIR